MKKEILIGSAEALGRVRGGGGGSKFSDTITTFYHPTKLRCPNVKILGSNMVSRNLENGSNNMEKKYTSTLY